MDADALQHLVAMSPHVRSLCVALCPPWGPLRLRPGEAGSAALAGVEIQIVRLLIARN